MTQKTFAMTRLYLMLGSLALSLLLVGLLQMNF